VEGLKLCDAGIFVKQNDEYSGVKKKTKKQYTYTITIRKEEGYEERIFRFFNLTITVKKKE